MGNSASDKTILKEDKFLNALAQAYRLQESIISATELSIISFNTEGLITSFNNAAESMLGYAADEVIGKETPLIFHDRTEIIQCAERLSRETKRTVKPDLEALTASAHFTGKAFRQEWSYLKKDGKKLPVMVSVTALRDDTDQLTGYALIATDITEQKEAEKKIRESEMGLNALVNSIDDIILEVDEHGRYLNIWMNERAQSFLTGKDKGTNALSKIFGERFGSGEIITRVLATGEAYNQEYQSVIEGEERWFNARFSEIRDKDKSAKRVSVCIQDITERKKTEFALRESEEKFRLLAENIPGIIYVCRNDGNFSPLYTNDRTLDILGYHKEELLGGKIHITDLFHPDDASYVIGSVKEAITERKNFHLKYRVRHKSGEWKWVEEYGTGVYGDNGLLWIEGFISDITRTKSAEEEYFLVFNSTLSLNAISGFDGYFKKLNPAWEKTLGWSIEELKEHPIMDFIHPDDLRVTRGIAEQIKGGKDGLRFENRYRCKDGSYRWFLWTSSVDVQEQIIYSSAIDITDRKRTEEALLHSKHNVETVALKLQEQNRQLDEFAHIISHNLRSPLGNIQALISFLNEGSTIDEYKMIFEKLKNVSRNLTDTMSELMDILKIKKNTNVERVELRFKEVLDKVVQSLEGDLIQYNASLTYDFNNAPKLSYSKTYLESIFQNLLSNALKYRSPHRTPQIHFESLQSGNQIELRVSDNGLGIDMERYGNKLFGLHKTFHVHKEAKGVGLFLTKTQIETLGGSISAESEVDKGTTFVIRFNQ